ncbi:hypothetical protein MXB_2604 [Myxobolus squamalis]|nr:hypothetical protein MXB_2604 [Myxobolus squamalis]
MVNYPKWILKLPGRSFLHDSNDDKEYRRKEYQIRHGIFFHTQIMDSTIEPIQQPGVIYLSNLPDGIKPLSIRQLLSKYGEIGRIFLKKDSDIDDLSNKKLKSKGRYIEGWVEFVNKKIAKHVSKFLNSSNMGSFNNQLPAGIKKRHKYYDYTWNIRYLPGFEWSGVNHGHGLEPGSYSKRKTHEIIKTKKEVKFYLEKADKDRLLNKIVAQREQKNPGRAQKSSRTVKYTKNKNIIHQHQNKIVTPGILSKLFK